MTTDSDSNDSLIRKLSYPALDGLRFYAAFLVFMVHSIGMMMTEYFSVPARQLNYESPNRLYAFMTWLADGNHGVDIFFVISGFLMARIVFGRKIGWLTFVGKRLRRIYPAFLVSLVIVTAINCGLFGWPFHWKDFGLNLVFYNAVPGSGIVPYNYVTWSLGLEFAFYLLVPLVGYVARILDARVAATLALVIAYAFVPDSVTRFIGLFVGLLIGSFGDSQLRKLAGVIPVTGVLLCYALLVVVKGYSDPPYLLFYRWLLLLVGFGVICIAFGDNWLSRLLSMPTLRRLGTLSYSFYLFHPVCIALVMRYLLVWLGVKPYPWVALPIYFVASFLLTVAVSYASYNLLEAPYFRAKTKSIESLHVAPVPVS